MSLTSPIEEKLHKKRWHLIWSNTKTIKLIHSLWNLDWCVGYIWIYSITKTTKSKSNHQFCTLIGVYNTDTYNISVKTRHYEYYMRLIYYMVSNVLQSAWGKIWRNTFFIISIVLLLKTTFNLRLGNKICVYSSVRGDYWGCS